MLAARAKAREARRPGFTPVASQRRLSDRGQPGQSWRTKRWTPARIKARDEDMAVVAVRKQPKRSLLSRMFGRRLP